MTNEEKLAQIKKEQTEIDNISYELSKLVEQKDSGVITGEQFTQAEAELKALLAEHTKALADLKISLEATDVKLEETKVEPVELNAAAKKDQAEIQAQIDQARRELEVVRREFEKYTKVMQDVHQYSNKKLQNGPLNDSELHEVYDDYYAAMYGDEAVWKEYQSRITRLERKVKRLERKSRLVEEHYVEATNLEIEYVDYKEIIKTLESRKRLNKILEEKGLGEIIHKRGGRSNKEKELLKEAKEQIVKEILSVMKKDKKVTILDAINILYHTDSKVSIKEAARTLKVPPKIYDKIQANLASQPQAVQTSGDISREKSEDTPKAPEDMPRNKVLFEDYEPDRIMYTSRNMTEEEYIIEQFEKQTGIKFDPEIHEIVYNHDASGIVSDDDVYSTYTIVERVPVDTIETPQEVKEEEKKEEKEQIGRASCRERV